MVQIYFEAPHFDTHILGRENTSDTQKHILTQLRPYSPNARGGNNAAWYQQSFCSYPSPQTPANNGPTSLALAHVPCARIPPVPVSHPYGASGFVETSNCPLYPSVHHPGHQPGSHSIHVPPFESNDASAGYQNFSEWPRPDTVIHIYNNPPALLPAHAGVGSKSQALPRR